MENTQIKIFEEKKVRTIWDAEKEEWYVSVVDVVAVLTESANPNNYWKVLKNRLKKEGSQLVTNCNQLKMPSSDGKMYKTDCMNTEQLFPTICKILWMVPQLQKMQELSLNKKQGNLLLHH